MLHPHVETRRTTLRKIDPLSRSSLREFLLEKGLGAVEGAEEFLAGQEEEPGAATAHILVERAADSAVLAFASLRRSAEGGDGYLQTLQNRASLVHGIGIEANLLLMNYLFATWDIKRVYFCPVEDDIDYMRQYPGMVTESTDTESGIPGWPGGRKVFYVERDNWERIASMFLRILTRKKTG